MFDTGLIHIGTEKTGTTSIQNFFAANRRALAARGFFYPRSLGPTGHSRISAFAAADHKQGGVRRRALHHYDGDVEAFRGKLEAEFLEEVRDVRAPKLLISSEHCHSLLATPDEVGRLKALLDKVCRSYRIILYLRRQDRLAVSLFSTKLKIGGSPRLRPRDSAPREVEILPKARKRLPYYYDYRAVIENYRGVFGEDSVTVRLFDRKRMVGGDAIDDIASVIGLGDLADLERPKRKNESISELAQRFLTEFNKSVPLMVDGKINRYRGNVSRVIEQRYSGRGKTLARAEARDFYARFAEGNDWIRQTYFPDLAALFDDDFSEYPEAVAAEALGFEDAVRIAADLWVSQMDELFKARSEVKLREATLALRDDQRGAALALAREAVELNARNLPAQQLMGSLLGDAGGAADAVATARAAVAAHPADARLHVHLGRLLAQEGDWDGAAAAQRAALAIDPQHEAAQRQLKRALNQKAGGLKRQGQLGRVLKDGARNEGARNEGGQPARDQKARLRAAAGAA